VVQSSAATSSNGTQRRDSRRFMILALYVVVAVGGIARVANPSSWILVLYALLLATIATEWCVLDAYQRGRPIVSVVQMIMFFTWPLAVPVYLIVSRGWRGVAYAVLHAIGLYATATLFAIGTWALLFRFLR
jgi:hypothetical protein